MKKISVSAFVALALMLLLSVSVVAATIEYPFKYRVARFLPQENCGVYLNIYGNAGSTMSGRHLSLFRTSTPGQDQEFIEIEFWCGGRYGTYWVTYQNSSPYAINKNLDAWGDGYDSLMWKVNVNHNASVNTDSAFERDFGSPFNLMFSNYKLAYTSPNSGARVYFNTVGSYWYTDQIYQYVE